jgi:hypothetical protein
VQPHSISCSGQSRATSLRICGEHTLAITWHRSQCPCAIAWPPCTSR